MAETLDSIEEVKTGNVFYVKSGRLANDTVMGAGIVLAVCGALQLPYSAVMWVPAWYIFFSTTGYKFDCTNNKIMRVVNHFGFLSSGSWKDNDVYKEIAIMGSRTTHAGRLGWLTIGYYRASNIHVQLLDKYHVKRFAICEANTVEEAEKIAASISAKTGFPVVKFNPVRLTKTRRR